MSPENSPEEISFEIGNKRFQFPADETEVILDLTSAAEAAYAKIREIDTTGIEPAAIFVPTPSKRVSN